MSDKDTYQRIRRKLEALVEASVDVSICAVTDEHYKGKKLSKTQIFTAVQVVKGFAPKVDQGGTGGVYLHLNVPRPTEVKTLDQAAPAKVLNQISPEKEYTDEASYSSVKPH